MDLERFIENLQQLREVSLQTANEVEQDTNYGRGHLKKILSQVEGLLPDWFYFIEQTGIGEKSTILDIVKDIVDASDNEDQILLIDTLVYGLGRLADEYQGIIREALDGS